MEYCGVNIKTNVNKLIMNYNLCSDLLLYRN
jgi:hypothetical protein